MKVRDVMTREVLVAGRDTPVNQIARLMVEGGVSAIPVVEESGKVAGIVTELDLIVRNTRLEPPAFFRILDGQFPLETPGHYQKRLQHMLGTRAEDVMTEGVATVGPDLELEELAQRMVDEAVNPLCVVEGGALVGIVSRADIVRTMAREVSPAGERG